MAARYCDRLLLMDGGALVADGAPMEVLTPERLASVYGVAERIDVSDGLPLIVPTARVRSITKKGAFRPPCLTC